MKKPSKLAIVPKPSSQGAQAKKIGLNFNTLNAITDRAFFLALQMIDAANHKRPVPGKGEPKVGGHPSACASSKHILAAIHLVTRKPEDYLACKPHVSPIDHAFNFLLQNFRDHQGNPMPLEDRKIAMRNLRHYSKTEPVFQSYHAEADPRLLSVLPIGFGGYSAGECAVHCFGLSVR